MTDQIKTKEQRELWFWSEIDEKTYTASELSSMTDDLIRQLLSESTNIYARLHATTIEINEKKTAGLDWNFDWYVRVRAKKYLTEHFKNLVSRELKHRERLAAAAPAELSSKIARLEREIANLKKKNDSVIKKDTIDKLQKKYEFEKRKKFYELIIDVIGKPAFNELMLKAAKSASLLHPGPWVDPLINAEAT